MILKSSKNPFQINSQKGGYTEDKKVYVYNQEHRCCGFASRNIIWFVWKYPQRAVNSFSGLGGPALLLFIVTFIVNRRGEEKGEKQEESKYNYTRLIS